GSRGCERVALSNSLTHLSVVQHADDDLHRQWFPSCTEPSRFIAMLFVAFSGRAGHCLDSGKRDEVVRELVVSLATDSTLSTVLTAKVCTPQIVRCFCPGSELCRVAFRKYLNAAKEPRYELPAHFGCRRSRNRTPRIGLP